MASLFRANDDNKSSDDLDFNFDDFNFDVPEPKDNRHPIVKALAPVARGGKDYITNTSNIEKFVKAILPVGYGQAYDLFQEGKSEFKQLYNSVGEEIKPAKDTSKSLFRKALPHLDGKIPKGLQKKLEELTKEEQQWARSQGDGREEQLGSLLTSIFETKAQDELSRREETNAREKIREGFEQIRHRQEMSQLDAIRVAVQSQVAYQNKISHQVQKKQLELQYRTFWALADLNKEQKRSNAELLTNLKAITTNTGLPDFAKITVHESFKQVVRNKFLDNAREGMFGGAQDYFRKFARNIKDQVVNRVRDYASPLESMGSMADGMADTVGSMGDMPGFNARDELIAQGMSLPLDWISDRAGRMVGKHLAKNRKLRRGGSQASHFVNTFGDRVHKGLTRSDKNWGALEGIREFLASAAPSALPDSKLEVDRPDLMHMPRPFSRSNSKSLDEVIPGLLSRIHREIRVLRTGDDSTPLTVYDYTKNKFSTEKQLTSDLRKTIAGHGRERASAQANKIVNRIDRGGKLTPQQRESLRQQLIKRAVNGETIDISKSHMAHQWGGGDDGMAIAGAFSKYLRADSEGNLSHNDQSYRRQIEMMQEHRGIVSHLGDPRVLLQQLSNQGQLQMLKEMGIVDKSNNIDREKYAEWLMNEEATGGGSGAPAAAGGAGPVLRRTRGATQFRKRSTSPGLSSLAGPSAGGATVTADVSQDLRALTDALSGKQGGAVEKNVESIREILEGFDAKYMHATDVQQGTLVAMLYQLQALAGAGGGAGSTSLSGPGPGAFVGPTQPQPQAYTSLWAHAKGVGGQQLGRARNAASRGLQKGRSIWDRYAPGVRNRAGQIWGQGTNLAKDSFGKLKDYYGDVVVSGEAFPRLRANLIKAGEYRDKATGRVITSLEDITGDVVDSAGNLVITLDEFYDSYVTGSINKKVKDLFGKLKYSVMNAVHRAQDIIPSKIAALKDRVMGMATKLRDSLPPYDVYVKNDPQRPLLYANLMKYNEYYSVKTDKVLTHPRFIDGPVRDSKGNIVVSEDHLKIGLVDVQGDPVGGSRWIAKTVRKTKQVWEMLREATAGIFGALGKGLGNVNEYFKNFFTPFADMITNSKKTVTLLEKIHDLLDERMPGKKIKGDSDGDGIRDGSIEDIHRHREHAAEQQERAAAGRDGTEGKSGGVLKLLAGLFGKKKKGDDEEHDEHGDHESLLDEVHDAADIYDDVRGEKGSPSRRKAAKARLKRMQARGKKPGFLRRLGGKLTGKGRLGRFARAGMFNTRGVGAAGRVAGGLGSTALRGGVAGAGVLGRGALGMGRWATGGSKLAKLARWGMFNTDLVGGAAKGVGFLGRHAGLLGRGLGVAGLGMSAYSAVNNLSEGNYGAAALDAGMGLGSGALMYGGLGGLASGAAAVGGGLLTGLGAVLSSPFLIPALAVGAAGFGAYKLYKWSQKTKLTPLSKLRLAQYGFAEDDDDAKDKIFQLEQTLEPLVTIKDDGNMILDEKKLDLKDIAESFDIHRDADMKLFNMWYRRRFVPVYRKWMTELRKRAPDGRLAKVDDLIPGKEKLAVASSAVAACQDAYSHMVGWNEAHAHLVMDADGVQHVLDSIRMDLEKEREADGGAKAVAEQRDGVSTTRDAAGLAALALKDAAHYQAKDAQGNDVDVTGMDVGDLTEKIKKGALTVSVAVALPASLVKTDPNRLDALASIRYKAYGLTHMTADKVRMLGALELFMGDHLTDDDDNPKLTINTDVVMQAASSVFGVPNATGEHAVRWKTWFNGRFLPVFLLWAGAMRKKTGKKKLMEASDSFKVADQLTTARAIIGAQGIGTMGIKTSIWNNTTNPWSDDYEMNTDPDSTAGNLEAIRLLADKVRLGEVSATQTVKNKSENYNERGNKWFNAGADGVAIDPGMTGKDAYTGGRQRQTQATGDGISAATSSADAKPLSGMGDAVKFSGGGGGNYTDLPASGGKGWSANRDLILKAAKMAGVDPKALIATIAIESGFDPNAAPKNPNLPSSAKGFGQHLDSSWVEDLQKSGKAFGIPNGTNQFDARASVLMTAARLKRNAAALGKALGRAVTTADLYLAHLMGLGGAMKFLKAPQDAIGAEESPTTAKQHPMYFYDGSRALTVKEVYKRIADKLAKRPAEFGVTEQDTSSAELGAGASTVGGGSAGSVPEATVTTQPGSGGPAPRGSGGYPGGQAGGGATAKTGAAPASYANTPSAGSPSLGQTVVMQDNKSAVMGTGPAIVKNPNAKYELILQREESEEDGTYGTLRLPDGTTLNTLELPWRNNDPQSSCIPPGSYTCKKRPSQHFGAAYEVQGVQGRSAILIHAGNTAGSVDKGMKADSKGCILLGMDRGRQGNQKVITASKAAMKLFYEKMQDMDFTLIVRPGKGGLGTGDAKSKMSFDPVRGPGSTAASPQAAAGFTPTGPRPGSAAPGTSSPEMPNLNRTVTGFTPAPTKADMQGRDAAMSDTIAPKIDNIANTLLKSLDVQTDTLGVLKQFLAVQSGGAVGKIDGAKDPKLENAKVRPVSEVAVPVPQRRKTM